MNYPANIFPAPYILYHCRGVGCGVLYEPDELYFWEFEHRKNFQPGEHNGTGFYCQDCLLQIGSTQEAIKKMRSLEDSLE